MTKRSMAKKFMRETGADKKTAMDYLRKCQWNYGQAKSLYFAPQALAEFADRIANIDLSDVIAHVAESLQIFVEKFTEFVHSDEFQAACRAVIEERRNADDGGSDS